MADYDHVRDLENLRDQYVNAANVLMELAHEVALRLPDRANAYEQWGGLTEQNRNLTEQALNRAIDSELRR